MEKFTSAHFRNKTDLCILVKQVQYVWIKQERRNFKFSMWLVLYEGPHCINVTMTVMSHARTTLG